MAWRNGGGSTTEIAVAPAGAPMETFDWRVSMAKITADGPFSVFAGVDRWIAVPTGTGIRLDFAGQDGIRLDPASPPLAFPAAAAASCTLLDGPTEDVNVMTRRGRLRRMPSDRPVTVALENDVVVLLTTRELDTSNYW